LYANRVSFSVHSRNDIHGDDDIRGKRQLSPMHLAMHISMRSPALHLVHGLGFRPVFNGRLDAFLGDWSCKHGGVARI
jgi:hypothetical protein